MARIPIEMRLKAAIAAGADKKNLSADHRGEIVRETSKDLKAALDERERARADKGVTRVEIPEEDPAEQRREAEERVKAQIQDLKRNKGELAARADVAEAEASRAQTDAAKAPDDGARQAALLRQDSKRTLAEVFRAQAREFDKQIAQAEQKLTG